MTNRTPHGTPIPENFNQLRRPPRPITAPEDLAFLASGGFAAVHRAAGRSLNPVNAALHDETATDLRQFRRVLNGDRELPGEYSGNDAAPYLSLPFAPKAVHRPDRDPANNPASFSAHRKAVENIDASLMTSALAARMGTDARPPEDGPSLWDRMGGSSSGRTSSEPSLRDHVEASASAIASIKE